MRRQNLTLSETNPDFYVSAVESFFENTVGKGKIAPNEQFLLCHSVFYPLGELAAICLKPKIVVCIPFQFGKSKICSLEKG